MDPLSGEVLVVNKPLGWSSFHVVKKLRGAISSRLRSVGVRKIKVGHAGTLDPLATGVMIICTGRATKRIDSLQAGIKEYVATIHLGATTPSFDRETPIDAQYPVDHITRKLVDEVLSKFVGTIEQIPPEFSACKIDGHRAYKMARRGETVDLKPKTLIIDEIEVLDFTLPLLTLRIVCSKGTYIRALARDIGIALKSGGYLEALHRTRVGEHTITSAYTISEAVEYLLTKPCEITDDSGCLVEVSPMPFSGEVDLLENADIKPFDER